MKSAAFIALALCWIGAALHAAEAPKPPQAKPTPWSFGPLRVREPGAVQHAGWAQGRIDRFLLAQMEAAHLRPAPPADARVLIRRLYFDLLGLPPTAEELAHWVDKLGR